jgi:hypothetical protein
MLEGWKFSIVTDQKLLTYILSWVLDPYTPRQCRQLAYIAEFTSDIRHIAGTENVAADISHPPGHVVTPKRPGTVGCEPTAVKAPSGLAVAEATTAARLPLASVVLSDTLDYRRMAAIQTMCQDTLKEAMYLYLVVQETEQDGYTLLCNTSPGST